MILVIEDDDGAAWTVTEEVDKLNLSTIEGRERLANLVEDTISQLREETQSYNRECLDDDEEDSDIEAIKGFDEDGIPVFKTQIGYASEDELDLETSDRMADEISL